MWVIERHVEGGGLLRLAIMASTSSPVSPAAFIIQIDPAIGDAPVQALDAALLVS